MSTPGLTLKIVVAVAISVTTVAIALRFYTRIFIQHRFAADDWLILFSQINFLCFTMCVLEEVAHGIGEHLIDILMKNPDDLVTAMRFYYIAQTFYIFATCTVKFVIVIFFYSLHPPRALRIAALTMAVMSMIAGVGAGLFQIFQCEPIKFFWTRIMPGAQGACLEPRKSFALLQTFNAMDVVTDVVLALLPCIMVWNMTMSKVKKFGVSVLLGLGCLSAVSPFVRAFYFADLLDTSDFTYTAWPVTITSTTEPAIAITVVCFAQLRPLMRKVLPEGWFSSAHSHDQQNSPDRPVTFGAGEPRPKRRTWDMSLLEDTFGRSGNRTNNRTGNATKHAPAEEMIENRPESSGKESTSGSSGVSGMEKGNRITIHSERVSVWDDEVPSRFVAMANTQCGAVR